MASMITEAREGANQMIKATSGHVQAVLFDDRFDFVARVKTSDFEPFTDKTWSPRGLTALHDAILKAAAIADRVKNQERVHMVIVSDGLENSSQEATPATVAERLTAGKAAGWTVSYLGANQDAIAVGQALGLAKGDAATYSPTGGGVRSAFRGAMSRGLGSSDDTLWKRLVE